MLVLARKTQESVVIASTGELQEIVRVTVMEISRGKVKLGFQADNAVAIHREEVWERVCDELAEVVAKKDIEPPKYRVPYID